MHIEAVGSANMSMQEQRKSFRCTTAIPRPGCEIMLGTTVLPARLLDESAGGFAVLVNRPPSVEVNQLAQLHTKGGWYNVCIVHVAEVTPRLDVGNAVATEEGPWFRLGIRRLGEAVQPDQPAISRLAATLRFHLARWCPSGMMSALFGLLAVIVVVAAAAVMDRSWFAGHHNGGQARSESKTLRKLAQPVLSPFVELLGGAGWMAQESSPSNISAKEAKVNRSPSGDRESSFGASRGHRRETNATFTPFDLDLRETMRRLPVATALTLPEVVKELQLTASQQKKIGEIIDTTAQEMRELDQQLPGQQRQWTSQVRAELNEQAQQEALGLLTGRQLARWKELTGGVNTDSQPAREP
jgi:hypothetical protein